MSKIKFWGVSLQDVAYMGDDLCDLACLNHAGIAFCPADAVKEIRQQAHYVCASSAGYGAVREACDLILKINSEVIVSVSNDHSAC